MTRIMFSLAVALLVLGGCTTQRYGRLMPLSEMEKESLTCREIEIEQARASDFLYNVRMTRNGVNGYHVLGFLGDFGIGNAMEGNDAERSALRRVKDLNDLHQRRKCYMPPPYPDRP